MATTTIDSFAKQYLAVARLRGMTVRNPITFLFRPFAADQTNVFQVVCSLTEPSFADKAFNVLWIDANPGSNTYQSVLRRTSNITDGVHRGSWVAVADYSQLFTSRQYFRRVVENASSLGIDPGQLAVNNASTTRIGKVVMKVPPSDPNQAVAVSGSDPRMSDARPPTDHDHADFARTMVRLNSQAFVQVSSTNAPQEGYVLSITSQDTLNPNKFYAQWVAPTNENVQWESPRLLTLRISIPGDSSFIPDHAATKLETTAEWEDRVEQNPAGVEWSIEDNNLGITIAPDGTVTVPDLGFDTTLQVTASLIDPVYGNRVSATYPLFIRNVYRPDDALVSIAINGVSEMFAEDRQTFSVIGTYQSGNRVPLLPTSFISDSEFLKVTGLLGEALATPVNATATLHAEFNYDGQVFRAQHPVLIRAQVPKLLEIVGAAQIPSEQSASYAFRMTWTNGRTEQVTPDRFWAEPSLYTDIDGNKVTAKKEQTVDRNVLLSARITRAGVTVDGYLNIVVLHVPAPVFLQSLRIDGPNIIQERTSATYQFLATYSDGSIRPVDPQTFTSTRSDVLTIVGKRVTAGSVTADVQATLNASFVDGGIQKSASLALTVLNVTADVQLSSIRIVGATTVNQNTESTYRVTATYSDGSQRDITNPESFGLTQPSPYATVQGMQLIVGSVDVTLSPVTLTSTYSENGIRRTANLQVSLIGAEPVPVRLVIEGPDAINELEDGQYVCRVVLTNGNSNLTAATWSVIQGAEFGSIDQQGLLSAGGVEKNEIMLIRAQAEGLVQEKSVTIVNTVEVGLASATIQPITPPFAYGDPINTVRDLETILRFSDASQRAGTAQELAYTLSVPAQEYFELFRTTNWKIRAKKALTGFWGSLNLDVSVVATVEGISKGDTETIRLIGPTDNVESVFIDGADTIMEGTREEYEVKVKRLSGTITTHTTPPTWSIPTGGAFAQLQAGTQPYRTRVNVPAQALTEDRSAVLRASNVVVDGVTYTPEKNLRLLNDSTIPIGSELDGPQRLTAGQIGTYRLRLLFADAQPIYLDNIVVSYGNDGDQTAFQYPGNNTIIANSVTEDKTVAIKGTGTFQGLPYTANLFVTNAEDVPVLDWITIGGEDDVKPGSSTQYRAVGSYTDGSQTEVTETAVWTIGTITGGYTPTIVGGLLVVNAGTVAGSVVITATIGEVTRSKTVTITPDAQPTEYEPRNGLVPRVTSLAGYNDAFAQSLTNPMGREGQQILECPANSSTDDNGLYWYTMWPRSLGDGRFVEDGSPFEGGWDGANAYNDDILPEGPVFVTLNGVEYIIRRIDYPLGNNRFVFLITYIPE